MANNNSIVTVSTLAKNNEKIKEQLDKKINIQQDIGEAGKILGIDSTGNVVPVEAPGSVDISIEAGNMIEEKTDGIYVKDMSVKISAEIDNALIQKDDGLYVPTTIETKVSEEEGNIIETKDDGIYVASTDLSDYLTNDELSSVLEEYAKIPSSTAITLYIDNVNGSDNNDGLTTSTPLKTISTEILNKKAFGCPNVTIRFLSDYNGIVDIANLSICELRGATGTSGANISGGIIFRSISFASLYYMTINNGSNMGVSYIGSNGAIYNGSFSVFNAALSVTGGNVSVTKTTLKHLGGFHSVSSSCGSQINIGDNCSLTGYIHADNGTINITSDVFDSISGSQKYQISHGGVINVGGVPLGLTNDVYSKTEIDTLVGELATKTEVYTKEQVDDLITASQTGMEAYTLENWQNFYSVLEINNATGGMTNE